MPLDSVTEVTSESWFGRLGSAIKGVLIGGVLFVIAFPVLFWNEGRAVQTAKSLDEGAAAVVSVEIDKVDKANEGKLVHITGKAETDETLMDPDFGVSANAIRLTRQVAMYQWVEKTKKKEKKKLGGGKETTTTYNYSTEWSPTLRDSSKFHTPTGHANPAAIAFGEFSTKAEAVTVGAFKLSPALIGQCNGNQSLSVSSDDLPDPLALRLQAVGTDGSQGFYMPLTPPKATPAIPPAEETPAPAADALDAEPIAAVESDAVEPATTEPAATEPSRPSLPALSAIPTAPTVGDVHITFAVVEPAEVSVIASQIGDTFEPYQTNAGNALNMLKMGTKSADLMFAEAQSANKMMTWILRIVGFVLMLVGLSLVLRPLAVLGDIVPFIGSLIGLGSTLVAGVCALSFSLLTISVAWLFYRPLVGVPLLLAGVAALVFLFRMVSQRRKSQAEAA